jgi:hypothetical protein
MMALNDVSMDVRRKTLKRPQSSSSSESSADSAESESPLSGSPKKSIITNAMNVNESPSPSSSPKLQDIPNKDPFTPAFSPILNSCDESDNNDTSNHSPFSSILEALQQPDTVVTGFEYNSPFQGEDDELNTSSGNEAGDKSIGDLPLPPVHTNTVVTDFNSTIALVWFSGKSWIHCKETFHPCHRYKLPIFS